MANNRPTTVKEIKSFVKRASGRAITEWLGTVYRGGYRQGAFDIQVKLEEAARDTQITEGTTESTDTGEVSSD